MTNAAAPPPPDDVATPDVTRDCLLQVGAALLAGAAPVPDVEAQLTRLGARMGAGHVRVAATPTGVFVSTTPDQVVGFESVSDTLRFEQMTRVQQVVDNLAAGQMCAADAVTELADIEAMPASRPGWLCDLAILPISVGICAILQPTWRDLIVTAAGALLVAVIVMVGRRSTLVRTLQPLLASFGVGCVVLSAAQWWPLEGTLRTLVCSIAVLLPGSMIVTGMSEVASGAAVAGTARLVSGGVQLVLFAVGVFAAVAATGVGLDALTNVRASDLGPIAPFAGVALVGAGIVVNVAASRPAVPWIFAVLVLTFGTQWLVQNAWGVALGGLAGGSVAAASAALVHRFSGRPLRLVVFLPSFWLLVPGSLGLLSTAQFAAGHAGVSSIAASVGAVVGVAAGTLIGSAAGRAVERALDPARVPAPVVDSADVERH